VALQVTLVLVGGAWLRMRGIDWDAGQHLHPDERFLCLVESALTPVSSLHQYFDTATSSLNPHNRGYGFFVYGQLPVTVVQYVARWLARPGNDIDGRVFGRELGAHYAEIGLVGRGLSAACDVVSVAVVFLLGRRLYGQRVGRLGAALAGGTVMAIQQAHFFTVDSWATMWVVTAAWFAVRLLDTGQRSDAVLSGLAVGGAAASKISTVPVAGLVALAATLQAIAPEARKLSAGAGRPRLAVGQAAVNLNIALLAALFAFRIAQPYAFLPATQVSDSSGPVASALVVLRDVASLRLNPAWTEQMRTLGRMMSGEDELPPNHQWAQRTALVFPWLNLVRFGLGWPLGLAAWGGWLWGLVRIIRRTPGWRRHVLPVVGVGGYFFWQGTGWVKAMRYLLPIYPFLVLLAAWALVTAGRRIRAGAARQHLGGFAVRFAAVVPALAVMLATYGWALAFTGIYTRSTTRVAASRWIYAHVPPAARVHIDTGAGNDDVAVAFPRRWVPPRGSADELDRRSMAQTLLTPGVAQSAPFVVPRGGVLRTVSLTHVGQPPRAEGPPSVRVAVATAPATDVISERTVIALTPGTAQRIDLPPAGLESGRTYYVLIEALQGPLTLSGSWIGTEGAWDDSLPLALDGHDPWGTDYQEYPLELSWEDTPAKRARMQRALEQVDYLVISSNRFYASLPRNPRRWPMTVDYYRALFTGDLGFDLVHIEASAPSLGPFRVNDQSAEEAFTVYDHPTVLIFRKRASFRAAHVAEVLGAADLDRVIRAPAAQAVAPPVVLTPPTQAQP